MGLLSSVEAQPSFILLANGSWGGSPGCGFSIVWFCTRWRNREIDYEGKVGGLIWYEGVRRTWVFPWNIGCLFWKGGFYLQK